MATVDINGIIKELRFQAARSGGKGGQNVNKVSSKVEFYFDIDNSQYFTREEKERIKQKLLSRINQNGELKVSCDENRSQLMNRDKAVEKLRILLEDALEVPKERRKTKPTKASIAKRIEKKVKQAMKKTNRTFRYE